MVSVCSLVGLGLGVLAAKFERVGIALLGGASGFCVSLLLMQSIQLKNELAFWIVIGVVTAVCFGVSFTVSEYIKILSTSILGGYCIVRGVSCFAGGFPNEFITARELSNGVINAVPWSFYLYLASIVLISGLGTWW